MKTYIVERFPEVGVKVMVYDGEKQYEHLCIEDSLKLQEHSTGFDYGYGGSGPAQLALAILLDCFDRFIALDFYQDFKNDFLVQQHAPRWEVTRRELCQWLMKHGTDRMEHIIEHTKDAA